MKRVLTFKIAIASIFFLCGVAATAYAGSTSLFFGTLPKQVEEGERLTVDVRVQSSLQSINAISGAVTFPDSLVRVVSISKDKSIINLWTQEPNAQRNKILFEGVILNPGFQGESGIMFQVTFEARHAGSVMLGFSEGAILANDGLGTNILAKFDSASLKIIPSTTFNLNRTVAAGDNTAISGEGSKKLVALPVITDYSSSVASKDGFYLKGKGEPSALTRIVFKDLSAKSLGEQLIASLQNNKKKLDEALVKNDSTGTFEYISSKDLVAGVYNATPFLVDNNTNTEKPGLGVQLLVSDSPIVKALVVLLNILGLLIPIVVLGVIIYFIPWYSFKRMRVIKKKLGLEEEKINLSEHQLEHQDKIMEQSADTGVNPAPPSQLL